MAIINGKEIKYGGITSGLKENWNSYLSNADNDFVSVLILFNKGIMPRSTFLWMIAHSIEKYLKAYLSKNEQKFKNNHPIIPLWKQYKNISKLSTRKLDLNQSFDDIIENISTLDNPDVRYSSHSTYYSCEFLYFYIVLCSLIRYTIIGKKEYRSKEKVYGIDNACFLINGKFNPNSGKEIVQKILHLTLEHADCFTYTGFVNQMDFEKYSISNTAVMQTFSECPQCNSKSETIDPKKVFKFYKNL